MTSGALRPLLLATALGLMLGLAPRRAWAPSLIVFTLVALATTFSPLPQGFADTAVLGCGISVAVTALSLHLPGGPGWRASMVLSFNTGFWLGAIVGLEGSPLDLPRAAAGALVLAPASWLAGRAPIVVKVAGSWLLAVALLTSALHGLPVTPGYLPDHLD